VTAFFGFGFLVIGCFTMFIMSVTNTVPNLFPFWKWHRDDNPKGFRFFMIAYGFMAGVGALLVIAWLIGF
jgi:hypothetical protein